MTIQEEETRQKALDDLQLAHVKPKNTYEIEKTHSKSTNLEQGLNSTQQIIFDKVKEREREQNQEKLKRKGFLR